MSNLDWVRQSRDVDIVRAIYQHYMDATHPCHQRDDAQSHDLILAEESFIANIPARQPKSNDDDGEDGTPPAVEERWVVGNAGSAFWW
jgi:hypothetical protein